MAQKVHEKLMQKVGRRRRCSLVLRRWCPAAERVAASNRGDSRAGQRPTLGVLLSRQSAGRVRAKRTRGRAHARTHAHTHARTHARTHEEDVRRDSRRAKGLATSDGSKTSPPHRTNVCGGGRWRGQMSTATVGRVVRALVLRGLSACCSDRGISVLAVAV